MDSHADVAAGRLELEQDRATPAIPAAEGAEVPQHRVARNWQRFLAGGISGVAEVLASHPLDLVKTVMQHEGGLGRRASPAGIVRDIIGSEGLPGLYRGIVPRVLGVAPMRTVFWGTQSTCHSWLEDKPLPEPVKLLIVGTAAGLAQTVIDNPIEVLKTRSMVESAGGNGPSGAAGVRSAGAAVTATGLYGSRFPGFTATAARNVSFAAVFSFGLYWGAPSDGGLGSTFARGAAAGFVASVATQGLDYCKTVMQAPGGEGLTMAAVLRATPVRRLWTGAVPRALLGMTTMSVGAAAFSVVERELLRRT